MEVSPQVSVPEDTGQAISETWSVGGVLQDGISKGLLCPGQLPPLAAPATLRVWRSGQHSRRNSRPLRDLPARDPGQKLGHGQKERSPGEVGAARK